MEDLDVLTNGVSGPWISLARFLPLVCLVAAACVATPGCSTKSSRMKPVEMFDLNQVSVSGTRISYVEEGEGSPVVLVHGVPTSSFVWRKMIKPLSSHGRIYAPDLPGFGYSDPPPNADYSIARYAKILEGYLEQVGIENATFVCHDFGGPVVMTYALKHPEKVRALVILDTFLHSDLPMPLSMKIARIRPIGEIFFRLAGRSIVQKSIDDGVVDKSGITDEIVDRYYMPQGSPDKLKETMLGILRIDYLEGMQFIEKNLSEVDKPTLILWAEEDPYLPVDLGERIHRDIRGSKMVRIPDCGHFIQEDRPELAVENIVEFLSLNRKRGGEMDRSVQKGSTDES